MKMFLFGSATQFVVLILGFDALAGLIAAGIAVIVRGEFPMPAAGTAVLYLAIVLAVAIAQGFALQHLMARRVLRAAGELPPWRAQPGDPSSPGAAGGALHLAESAIGRLRGEVGRQAEEQHAMLRQLEASRAKLQRWVLAATDIAYERRVGNDALTWIGDVDQAMGYPPGSFPRSADGWSDLLHPDDRGAVLAHWRQLSSSAEMRAVEYRVRSADGGWRRWRETAVPVLDDQGLPAEWLGACQDITEQRRQEEERSDRVDFLESLEAVDAAIASSTDLDSVLRQSLEVARSSLRCERVCVAFPGDPDASTVRVMAEARNPSGGLTSLEGQDVPVTAGLRERVRWSLARRKPIAAGPNAETPGDEIWKTIGGWPVKFELCMAICPASGKPWLLVCHRGSKHHDWSDAEQALCAEIARRLGSALNVLLSLAELKRAEERLRLALDAGKMGVFNWDIPRGSMIWDGAHAELFGFAAGEFDGRYETFLSRVHADDRAGVESSMRGAQRRKRDWGHEFRVLWPDGGVRWIAGCGRCGWDEQGNPLRMWGIVSDVTKRRRDQAELLNRQLELFQIFNALPDGIVHADVEGRIKAVNPSFTRMTGYSPHEVIGRSAALFYASEDEFQRLGSFRYHPDSRGVSEAFEVEYVKRNGDHFLCQTVATTVRDSGDRVTGYLAVVRAAGERTQM